MRKSLLILWLLAMAGCEKPPINPIPDYPVYIVLNLNAWDSDLKALFSYKIITRNSQGRPHPEIERTGFGGILVAHGSLDEFYAYDMACPREVSPAIIVEITDGGMFAKCPECGSKYDITVGGVRISGPSDYNLKQYKVYSSGPDRLIIRN